ncbi:vacuolar protein-sorting-associated protein 25 isoform X2 [Venturia canescens]|uniref:vacuolar protein-sorting-associated protein 25 isoform X2 n=1 Tax=Venturia canescens TaxID=32260 RepID=UPI001C9CB6C5|nr:vacuolar protein-sorting-associated protein 25 isoform X2 [Venturia canescens]
MQFLVDTDLRRLQPHEETRTKQLAAWKSLVLDYLKATKEATIDIREIHSSPLFNNAAIKRKLSPEVVSMIMEDLSKSNNACPLDKSKQRWLVSWHTFQEWADIIYNWVQDRGMTSSVCTLFELVQGDDTVDQEFYGLDNEVLLKALRILEGDQKAELIMFDENQGVKFF